LVAHESTFHQFISSWQAVPSLKHVHGDGAARV
jgi:hypothetical protein